MTIKLILPLQSSGKMEVTPQQSEILQRELFKMGYRWWRYNEENIKHIDKPYIYWDKNPKDISFSEYDVDYFQNQSNPLHLFDNHFKIEE